MELKDNFKIMLAKLGPFFGLILIFVTGIILNGNTFFNLYNQINVLGRISIIALPAVGMTLVILSAGIDLSVGSIVSLSSVICAMLLMERSWTKASIIGIPIFVVFCLLAVFYIFNKITYKIIHKKRIANVLALLLGVGISSIILFLLKNQVKTGFSTLSVLLIVPVIGFFLGSFNGLVIAKGKIQPFIVTLGMMSIAVGLAKYIAGKGGQIQPIYYDASGFSVEGTSSVAPLSFDLLSGKISIFGTNIFPVTALFFFLAVLIVHFILQKLKFGRYIYAIGGNENTAKFSGINIDRVKTLVYGISGGLSALAGVLYCAAYTQGKPDAGSTWELDAIAAVVIGGTSLMGGKGSVVGTMVGVLILGYLGNILNLQEVSSEVQNILKGAIIIGAVLIQEGTIMQWLKNIRKPRNR